MDAVHAPIPVLRPPILREADGVHLHQGGSVVVNQFCDGAIGHLGMLAEEAERERTDLTAVRTLSLATPLRPLW